MVYHDSQETMVDLWLDAPSSQQWECMQLQRHCSRAHYTLMTKEADEAKMKFGWVFGGKYEISAVCVDPPKVNERAFSFSRRTKIDHSNIITRTHRLDFKHTGIILLCNNHQLQTSALLRNQPLDPHFFCIKSLT